MIERRKFLTAAIGLFLAPTAKLLGKEEVYIRNQVFKGQTLNIEGKSYFNCYFENCRFVGEFNLLQKCLVRNCMAATGKILDNVVFENTSYKIPWKYNL